MRTLRWLSVLSLFMFAPLTCADNGTDMSMDGAMALAFGQILPYLHFTPGDVLWFQGWVSESAGAMVGVCFGLLMLGLVNRWLAAMRGMAEAYWQMKAQILLTKRLKDQSQHSFQPHTSQFSPLKLAILGAGPSFIALRDIPRGALHAGQMTLNLGFMLAVMTYQGAFILSIVIGLGIGETLFGRYIQDVGH